MRTIVLAGGTGQVGTILARHYHAAGDDVVVLSRNPKKAAWRTVAWDAKTLGPWTSELENADIVFGLAGRSVNCRYNAANRRAIMASRVDSTHAIGQADRVGEVTAAHVAADEHGDDLRPPLRRTERRSDGHHRQQRTRRAVRLELQHRGRPRMGTRRRRSRNPAHP